MTNNLGTILARQIEPAFRMLISAVETCPVELWTKADCNKPVWQHLIHSTYYLDKWIRQPCEPFQPPSFVTYGAVDLAAPPEPAITPDQISEYLSEVVCRCRLLLNIADDVMLSKVVQIHGGRYTLMDQVLSQIRHSSYHIGCISAIFFRHTGASLEWIGYRSDPVTNP